MPQDKSDTILADALTASGRLDVKKAAQKVINSALGEDSGVDDVLIPDVLWDSLNPDIKREVEVIMEEVSVPTRTMSSVCHAGYLNRHAVIKRHNFVCVLLYAFCLGLV